MVSGSCTISWSKEMILDIWKALANELHDLVLCLGLGLVHHIILLMMWSLYQWHPMSMVRKPWLSIDQRASQLEAHLGHVMVCVFTRVLRFPDNTVIAWIKDNYREQGNIIITILLLPLGHITNKFPSSGWPKVYQSVGGVGWRRSLSNNPATK